MTLKQFFQLAGGIGIALLFYATALPAFIKWPFILFFSLLGTALAFLPFEERPLSTWIFAFFKAVYSPTRYVWAKGQAEEIFAKDGVPAPQIIATPQVPQPETVPELEQKETRFVQKVTEMFQAGPAEQAIPGVAQPAPAQTQQQRVVLQVEEVKNKEEVAIPRIEPIKIESVFVSQNTPPAPPQNHNTIAGQVLDREGKIIDGAILEIKDNNNLPVRALKSNKAGHFLTVTPLPNGEYTVTTDKEGFSFQPVKFLAEGKILAPIFIKAK